MKRALLINILKKYGYSSKDTINSILSGRRLPSMSKSLEMSGEIPLDAWKDIKSFITSNSTKNGGNTTRVQGDDNGNTKAR